MNTAAVPLPRRLDRFDLKSAIGFGLASGLAFGFLGVAFVAISVFTEIPRSAWEVLNQAKGVAGFGLCGLAGFLAARRTGFPRTGAVAGAIAGGLGGVLVPVAIFAVPFAFLEGVRQFPFEFHDVARSGAPSAKAFLLSPEGREAAFGTSVGLVPIVAPLAACLGGIVGFAAGHAGRRFSR